ncbi:hypothetical protein ASG39_06430 [Rhizobium sp. Leaf371]|nr:hypothetical protein ASG39_06430 [Rhizobium sp. Leaf371]TCM57782.1 hypothetical protein C8J36_102585 [Rhizobium sp. PP-F2F-G48]
MISTERQPSEFVRRRLAKMIEYRRRLRAAINVISKVDNNPKPLPNPNILANLSFDRVQLSETTMHVAHCIKRISLFDPIQVQTSPFLP